MGEECCGHDHSSEDVLEATIIEDFRGNGFSISNKFEGLDSRYLLGGGVAVVAIVLMLILSTLWTAAGPSIAGEGDLGMVEYTRQSTPQNGPQYDWLAQPIARSRPLYLEWPY